TGSTGADMGRIIVVHCREPLISLQPGLGEMTPAHCFSPFDDYQQALAHDAEVPDSCWKLALDLVGPDLLDMVASAIPEHGAHHDGWGGSGPSAGDSDMSNR